MLVTPTRALAIILRNVRPLKVGRKPLNEAFGCCLAEDVRADRDMPPADRSAMDGYAVRSADLAAVPCKLDLAGEVAAGSSARPRVGPGSCVRVLTGANVAPGADSVVKVEDTEESDGYVTFLTRTRAGANIRKRGEEVRKGFVVLGKGTILGASQIGFCASVGKAAVRVYCRPRPAILCTGEELRAAGERVRTHEQRDSNGPALRAALTNAGYDGITHQIVPDDPKRLAASLAAAAAKHDVLILTGGVSVGRYDYVPEAVRAIGATVRFHGVRMKPGKPQLYATLRGNRHIFGLPGNPLSVMTGFHELILPALRRMSGVPVASCRPSLRLPLTQTIHCKGTRTEFILARLVPGRNGSCVSPVKSSGSADLAAGTKADGAIMVPRTVREIPAGALVEFTPWRALP